MTEIRNSEWGEVDMSKGYIATRAETQMVMGLDCGKAVDPATICILRKVRLPVEVVDGDSSTLGPDLRQKLGPSKVYTEHAERLPLGMTYPNQARKIRDLWLQPAFKGIPIMVDRTGVGGGMVDILAEHNLPIVRVAITGGRNAGRDDDGSIAVPKIDLMAALMASFNNLELQISPKLPDFVEIMKQIRNMQSQLTAGGQITFNAAGSTVHDDYCTSLALSLYHLTPPKVGSRYTVTPLSNFIR